MKHLILFFILALGVNSSFAQTINCAELKKGKFHELDDKDKSSFYVFDGDWFYEYSDLGKTFIKSKIEWLYDCTYELTLMDTNIPNFDLEKGTKLRVQITKVEGNKFHYQYLPEGSLPPGVLVKVEQ